MAGEGPLSFGATVSLSCTTSTGRAAINLPAGQQLVITNLGPDLTYIAIGTVAITATTSGFPVLPGSQITITLPLSIAAPYVAGICPTSTSTLKLSSGDGILVGIAAASTGAGGGETEAVNLAAIGGTAVAAQNTNADNIAAQASMPSMSQTYAYDAGGGNWDRVNSISTAPGIAMIVYSNMDFLQAGQFALMKTGGAAVGATDQNLGVLGKDTAGNYRPMLLDLQGGVEQGSYSFTNITTATTTQVKSGAGVLHALVVNTKGTVASTIKVYDATSGTSNPICSVDSLNLSGTFYFDAQVTTGVRVITTGTVAPDVTILYR